MISESGLILRVHIAPSGLILIVHIDPSGLILRVHINPSGLILRVHIDPGCYKKLHPYSELGRLQSVSTPWSLTLSDEPIILFFVALVMYILELYTTYVSYFKSNWQSSHLLNSDSKTNYKNIKI